MRVVLLTQDDPFFLPKAIKKLHAGLPNDIEWVGTVLFEVSPCTAYEHTFNATVHPR